MRKILFGSLILFFMIYLDGMNFPKMNKSLEDNLDYIAFKDRYYKTFKYGSPKEINRYYVVYNALLDNRHIKDSYDPKIKSILTTMQLCDLDEEVLVLKGFHLEDSLSRLSVGKPPSRKKK